MLSQQLLGELHKILEKECSEIFEKSEVAKIATELCWLFELLAEASAQNNEHRRNKKETRGNRRKNY